MEWFKLFALIFSGLFVLRFVIALIIELFSDEPTKIKAPKIYELTIVVALAYIITYFIT